MIRLRFVGKGLKAVADRFRRVADPANPRASTALADCTREILADNRRGLLAGLDADGNPAPPLKSRAEIRRPGPGQRSFAFKAATARRFAPKRPARFAAYQQTAGRGPRLVPRGARSRAIADLKPGRPIPDAKGWRLVAQWVGIPWIAYHLSGSTRLPRYNVRGVRVEGRRSMAARFARFVVEELRR